jgi:hypothetical protein
MLSLVGDGGSESPSPCGEGGPSVTPDLRRPEHTKWPIGSPELSQDGNRHARQDEGHVDPQQPRQHLHLGFELVHGRHCTTRTGTGTSGYPRKRLNLTARHARRVRFQRPGLTSDRFLEKPLYGLLARAVGRKDFWAPNFIGACVIRATNAVEYFGRVSPYQRVPTIQAVPPSPSVGGPLFCASCVTSHGLGKKFGEYFPGLELPSDQERGLVADRKELQLERRLTAIRWACAAVGQLSMVSCEQADGIKGFHRSVGRTGNVSRRCWY